MGRHFTGKSMGVILSVLVLCFLCGCTANALWQRSTPEAQKVDAAGLATAEAFIKENLPHIRSLLIIKNDHLVVEKYYQNGQYEREDQVYSITKSILSVLFGIALEKGYIPDLDQKVTDYFPEYAELNSGLKKVTLRHLLTMSSGLEWNEDYSNPETPASRWMASEDWIEFSFGLRSIYAPGEVFEYASSNAHLLSVILSKATQMSTREFAQKYLFGPLDIRRPKWDQDPQGNYIGAFGLHLSPKDLTKLGALFLGNGSWNGQAIISEKWLHASTQSQIDAFPGFGYGYLWWNHWVNGSPRVMAWGMGGQFIVVMPDYQTFVVVTSKTGLPLTTGMEYMPLFDTIARAVGPQ